MTATKDDGTTEGVISTRPLVIDWRGAERRFLVAVVDTRGHELELTAADSFCLMRDDARRDGHELHINTAGREREHQQRLYDNWLRYSAYKQALEAWREAGKVGPAPKAVPWAAKAAPPGRSTHEIYCSVDLQRADGDDPATPEPDSPVDKWLRKHAHKYGWVFDVPSEPWHATHLASVERILSA